MRHKRWALIALLASLVGVIPGATAARAASEIVVSIRYLTPKGTSHAHLFLYREDGKLLRQLTSDNSGQDINPVFSPTGETIVFTREKTPPPREIWSVSPRGGHPRRLKDAPAWYKAARSSPYFTSRPDAAEAEEPSEAARYRAPDGSVELFLRTLSSDPADTFIGPGHGQHYVIRDLRSGREVEAGKLPGFEGLDSALHVYQNPKQRFLIDHGLRLAFFSLHLGSTDGDTNYALDLSGSPSGWRLVQLSPNWAAPFPLPGEPAFLTFTLERYVPIRGSSRTANCSYIERWDARLRKVRFARRDAALAYGASLYRPGKTPAVVTILKED